MILVGYTAVLGLLLLGVVDLVMGSAARDAERLKRARMAGAAAWLFGMGASALALGTGFSGIAAAPPEQQAVLLSGIIQGAVGPGALGMVGGMVVAGAAMALGKRLPQ